MQERAEAAGVPERYCLYLGQWMHADVIETKKKKRRKESMRMSLGMC